MALNDLALKYESDKSSALHDYCPHYERVIRPGRVNRVLEIGVLKGASLRMWRDWCPHAEVYGVDIMPESMIKGERRITTFLGSGDDREYMLKIARMHGPFDLIVDDGNHLYASQLAAFETLWPSVTAGGVYVIEDLASSMDFASLCVGLAQSILCLPPAPENDFAAAHFSHELAIFEKRA